LEAKYGGMDVSEAKRLKQFEDENARLKRLLADAMRDNAALKGSWQKNLMPAAKREAVARPRDERAPGVPRGPGGSQKHALTASPAARRKAARYAAGTGLARHAW